jgi:hypothetical protein
MQRWKTGEFAGTTLALIVGLVTAMHAPAEDAKAAYASMAPVEQYLMPDRDAEIAMARSAAPQSISADAEVLVLGRHGYETAVQGKNGFVCLVERGWSAPPEDPSFWNPKLRGPLCLNAAAARSYLPRAIKKTDLILAGSTKDQMIEAIKVAVEKKELPAMEPGAMCYMLSKQGYLNDQVGHWHPHLMFFVSQAEPATWGAGLEGSPVLTIPGGDWERLTIFLVPVHEWSDGTADH